MNKAELVELVLKDKELALSSRAQAERIVNSVIEGIKAGIKKDKSVSIVGFGSFTVRKRKARTGRNPQTGASIKIPASKTVGFKAGKSLKDSL